MTRVNSRCMTHKVAKSAEARQQLPKCGNSLDIEEEAIVSSLALLSMGTR